MSAPHLILLVVVIQRLAEVVYAERNARALLAAGGREFGRGHYPLFFLVHGGWLLALWLTVPAHAPIHWFWLVVFVLLQLARLWVIRSLGRFWTTRIIRVPGTPLVRHGPYRWLRHPNYWVVAGEIATLPLAFGAWTLAWVFSILNASLLAWRISIENDALTADTLARP